MKAKGGMFMAFKDKAQETKYKNEYAKQTYDIIKATPDKETGQRIRSAAAAAGQSVSAYVLQAVLERMDREK
jgi:uncharacterized protein (DUF1778 family)